MPHHPNPELLLGGGLQHNGSNSDKYSIKYNCTDIVWMCWQNSPMLAIKLN